MKKPRTPTVAQVTAAVSVLLCLIALHLITPPVDAGGDPPRYTVRDVGFVYGPFSSQIEIFPSINTAGQVAGPSEVSSNGPVQAHRTDAALTTVQRLGSLAGPNGFSNAYGINNSSQVVGESAGLNSPPRAFRHTDGTGMENLGLLPGDFRSIAYAINSSGQVVGDSVRFDGKFFFARAFRFTDGTGMEDLLGQRQSNSTARDINDASQVVGTEFGKGTQAYRFTDGTGPQLVPPLPGHFMNQGFGLISPGYVVGASFDTSGVPRAFFYDDTQIPAVLRDLGTLGGGGNSIAYELGRNGEIVGESNNRAFIWLPAFNMLDLNPLIPSNSGWLLQRATDINKSGQIVGVGRLGTAVRVFRLDPLGNNPVIKNCQVTPRKLGRAGGSVTITADVTAPLLDTVSATVTRPDQTTAMVPMKQVGQTDRFRGTFKAPASASTSTDVYGVTIFATSKGGKASAGCGTFTVAGQKPAAGRARVSVRGVEFGNIRVGLGRRESFFVRNVGDASLSGEVGPVEPPFTRIVIGGGDRIGPRSSVGRPFFLNPGEELTVTVQFNPTARRRFTDTILIASNDPDRPQVTVRVSGNGCGTRRGGGGNSP